MIRKNSLICKVISLITSSHAIFIAFMSRFRPERETCPICGSSGSCHIHGYYRRSLRDFEHGSVKTEKVTVLRVYCESCHHTHAILPDVIVPYSSYSLMFMLYVLAVFFTEKFTVDDVCGKFNISRSQLYKWVELWKKHKKEWLGILEDASTSDSSFIEQLCSADAYSDFAMNFVRRFSFSFLQKHKNPMPIRNGTAGYCQQVFEPDYIVA